MMDMAELKKRKVPLNLAIVHVDPDAFIANFVGWLEITAFITAQQAGEAQVSADGEIPKLSQQQLRKGGVHDVGNDAIFAFCMGDEGGQGGSRQGGSRFGGWHGEGIPRLVRLVAFQGTDRRAGHAR